MTEHVVKHGPGIWAWTLKQDGAVKRDKGKDAGSKDCIINYRSETGAGLGAPRVEDVDAELRGPSAQTGHNVMLMKHAGHPRLLK